MNIKFTKISRYTILLSLVIIISGIVAMTVNGLNYGIDFAGGAIIYINIGQEYDIDDVRDIINSIGAQAEASYAGENNQDVIIRMPTDEEYKELSESLIANISDKYGITDDDVNIEMVGPSIGRELTLNAIKSIGISWVLILIYVWIRFELRSGVIAIVALIHDMLIMFSFVAIFRMQVNSSFVAAILTIIGYSINDTIVIFDRIRENVKRYGSKKTYPAIVDESVNSSLSRTVNTSLTTLLTITMVYILGVESIKEFTLPIIIGLVAGTYSSIFITGPLWSIWSETDRVVVK